MTWMLRIPHSTTLRCEIISVSSAVLSGIAELALTFRELRLAGRQKECFFYRKQTTKYQNMETARFIQSQVQTATLLLAPMLIKDSVKGHGGVTWEGDRGRGGGGGGEVAEERDEEQKRGGSLTQALFACAVSSLVCRSGSLEERTRRIHRGSLSLVHKQRACARKYTSKTRWSFASG